MRRRMRAEEEQQQQQRQRQRQRHVLRSGNATCAATSATRAARFINPRRRARGVQASSCCIPPVYGAGSSCRHRYPRHHHHHHLGCCSGAQGATRQGAGAMLVRWGGCGGRWTQHNVALRAECDAHGAGGRAGAARARGQDGGHQGAPLWGPGRRGRVWPLRLLLQAAPPPLSHLRRRKRCH